MSAADEQDDAPPGDGCDERPCPGCLGTAECWVCLGTGAQDTRTRLLVCSSCAGTRSCRYCAPVERPRRRAVDRLEPVAVDRMAPAAADDLG